jgi:hypothetical protein
MTAPRYRTNIGLCSEVYKIGDALVQYDLSGNPVVINLGPDDRKPYFKCPTLTNPTAGMATSTNDTNISKKMRYAQLMRTASALKGGQTVYAVNRVNAFNSRAGAPGGSGSPITNSF